MSVLAVRYHCALQQPFVSGGVIFEACVKAGDAHFE